MFGDTTGALIGAAVFLLTSTGIGAGFFIVSRRLLAMGTLDLEQPPSKVPIVLGIGVGVGLFLMIYQSSLAGFRSLEVQGDRLTLHYDFPPQDSTYPAIHMTKVEPVPAFKGPWRLVVVDIEGTHHYSALARRQEVEKAWAALRPLLGVTPSVQHPAS
jgi:hypothetical protein